MAQVLYASEPGTDYVVTVNWDLGVDSVYCEHTNDLGNVSCRWTTPGQKLAFFVNWSLIYTVNLRYGFKLSRVYISFGSIEDKTETTFKTSSTGSEYTLTICTEFVGTKSTLNLRDLDLANGNHTCEVKAEGAGFSESNLSNALNFIIADAYLEAASAETPFNTNSTYIKSGAAPQSSSDYDYESVGGGTLQDNSNTSLGNLVGVDLGSYYIWGYGYYLNDNKVVLENSYSNAQQISLTKGDTLALLSYYSMEPQ